MIIFEQLLNKYYKLLNEQPNPMGGDMAPDAGAAPAPDAGGMPPPPDAAGATETPAPAPVEEASPAKALLVEVLYKAFTNQSGLKLGDEQKKFSDNGIADKRQAYIALQNVIIPNLSPESQAKIKNYSSQGGKFGDVDDNEFISIIKLILKALFEDPKLKEIKVAQNKAVVDSAKNPEEPNSTEYVVTTKNANTVLAAINNYDFADNEGNNIEPVLGESGQKGLQFQRECIKYFKLMN